MRVRTSVRARVSEYESHGERGNGAARVRQRVCVRVTVRVGARARARVRARLEVWANVRVMARVQMTVIVTVIATATRLHLSFVDLHCPRCSLGHNVTPCAPCRETRVVLDPDAVILILLGGDVTAYGSDRVGDEGRGRVGDKGRGRVDDDHEGRNGTPCRHPHCRHDYIDITHTLDIRTYVVAKVIIFDSLIHPRPRRSLSSDISARRSVDVTRSSSMLPATATDVSDGDTPAGAILTSPASIGGAPARPRLSVSPAKSQRGPDEAAESTIQSGTTLMAFAASGGVRKSPFPVFDNVALLYGA